MTTDLLPSENDVVRFGVSGADGEADDERVANFRRHHIDLGRTVDSLQQVFAQLVGAFETEADQSHGGGDGHLEALVFGDEVTKFSSQGHLVADVTTQSFRSVRAHDEPQLERSKPAPQRNLPVAVIGSQSLTVVLQIQRIDVERVH